MIEINLIPYREQNRLKKAQSILLSYVVLLVVVLAACGGTYFYFDSELTTAKQEKEKIEAELAQLKKKIGKVNEYKKAQQSLQKKVAALAELKSQRKGPVRIMDELAVALDDKVWVETFKDSRGSFELNGYALTEESVASFMRRLAKSDYFSNVDLEGVDKSKKGNTTVFKFKLTVQLVTPAKKEAK